MDEGLFGVPHELSSDAEVVGWSNQQPQPIRCFWCASPSTVVIVFDYRGGGGNYRDHVWGCEEHVHERAQAPSRRSSVYVEARWDPTQGCWVPGEGVVDWD